MLVYNLPPLFGENCCRLFLFSREGGDCPTRGVECVGRDEVGEEVGGVVVGEEWGLEVTHTPNHDDNGASLSVSVSFRYFGGVCVNGKDGG